MLRFAFRFISYDKAKSIGVVLGIVISTFLVGQQTGIFLFLTGAMASIVDNTQTDLWVVDNKTTNVNALGPIDIRIGYQLESIPGVRKAYPFIVAGGTAKFLGGDPPRFRSSAPNRRISAAVRGGLSTATWQVFSTRGRFPSISSTEKI
jgi:hypothetical protein